MKTWFVVIAVFCCVSGSAYAQKNDAKTYRCTTKDAVNLEENGVLARKTGTGALYLKNYNGVIIDTLTGAITYADGSRQIWRVVEQGDDENDHILIPQYPFKDTDELASIAATDFIRVSWKGKPEVTLMVFSISILVTGSCEVVR